MQHTKNPRIQSPETSIIIRAFNEAKHLPALLDGLRNQSYQDFEVLLVDSGSVDGSREIALNYGCQVIQISHHDFTFGYSLNMGIKSAQGQFMAIVSAHTIPSDTDWLQTLIEPLRQDAVAIVFGRQLGVRSSKFSEVEDFRRTFGLTSQIMKPPNFFANNANSAIRKDLWNVEPFDETLPGLEDIAWTKHWMTNGYEAVYQANAALYHIHEESWRQVFHRYYREAVAANWIGIKSQRHVLTEPLKEVGYAIEDLIRCVMPRDNLAASRLKLTQRATEIILFRYYKAKGTVRGLLDGRAMKSPSNREHFFFDRSTRAVVVTGPGRASITNAEMPEIRPGEVVVRVDRIAVCSTDLEIFNGSLGYYKDGLAKYPITPGHEFCGTIVDIGVKVTDRHYGDRVVVECIQSCGLCSECLQGNQIGCPDRTELGVMGRDGGYAEHVVVPAKFTHIIPDGLDPSKAALIEPLAVIHKAIKRIWPNGSKPTFCAVVGAGPLGHLCARVLAAEGHDVRVYDRKKERLEFLSGSGVEVSQDIMQIGDHQVVFEVTGDPGALDTVLHETSSGTIIVLLGLPYGPKEFSFEKIAAYDKSIVGSVGSTKNDFQAAIQIVETLDLVAFQNEPLPLASFFEAWKMSKKPENLKVFIDPRL